MVVLIQLLIRCQRQGETKSSPFEYMPKQDLTHGGNHKENSVFTIHAPHPLKTHLELNQHQWKWERPVSSRSHQKVLFPVAPIRGGSKVGWTHPTKARTESDFWPSLTRWHAASSCWCASPLQAGCLHRWGWWSGCQRTSWRTWRTCGTWPRDPRGRVGRVRD